jgi:hypothetical protein
MLLLIGPEYLDIRTHLRRQRRGQDRPPMSLLGGKQSLGVHDQTIADLDLGCRRLRWTASTRPLCGRTDRFYTIVKRMIAPEARLAAPPSLPPAFIVGNGRLGISRTGKPAGFHALDVLGDALGLPGLGAAVGRSRLLGQLAGVHDEKPEFFHSESPVSVLYFHRTDDTVPMPVPWRLLPSPTRLFEQQRQ